MFAKRGSQEIASIRDNLPLLFPVVLFKVKVMLFFLQPVIRYLIMGLYLISNIKHNIQHKTQYIINIQQKDQ